MSQEYVKFIPVPKESLEPLRNLLEYIVKIGMFEAGSSICLGMHRFKVSKKKGISDNSFQFVRVFEACKDFMDEYFPLHEWNQIYLHYNHTTKKHTDKLQKNTMCVGFGEYTGGEIVVELPTGDQICDSRYRATFYNGTEYVHYNLPITGTKFSLCPVLCVGLPAWHYKIFRNGIEFDDMEDGIPKQVLIPPYMDPWSPEFDLQLYRAREKAMREILLEEQKDNPT